MRLLSRLMGLFAVFAGIAFSGAAFAQSTVEGTIAFDGRPVPMTHVYARQARGWSTSDEPGHVKILISDREAPGRVATSQQAYYEAARTAQVQGLILNLEAAGRVRLVIFAPGGNMDDTFVPDVLSQLELTDFVRQGDWVSGRLRTTQPRELTPSGEGPNRRPATPSTCAFGRRSLRRRSRPKS